MMTEATAVKQQTGPNTQTMVTSAERQALFQKLITRCPTDVAKQIESQAYEKSHGIKLDYFKLVQAYFQKVQTMLQNRASQLQQNNNGSLQNGQVNGNQQSNGAMVSQIQPTQFPMGQQQSIRPMMTPQTGQLNQMPRLREPAKFNPTPTNTFTYSQSSVQPPPQQTATPTIDISQGQGYQQQQQQQMNTANQNDYSTPQSRYPMLVTGNVPRQRPIIPNNNFQAQASTNNSSDLSQQYVVSNSSLTPAAPLNANNLSNGDQLLQRILLSNIDGGTNKATTATTTTTLTRQATGPLMTQPTRPANSLNSNANNSTSTLRSTLSAQQLSPSPSVVIIPTPSQTSTVQIQPQSNVTVQQSPLSNNSGPFSTNSQSQSTNSSTPVFGNYSSPANRTLQPSSISGIGSISSPDEEILNLIKYLKENAQRLQVLAQKFTSEGNTDKVRQVQSIYQQIGQFVNNPTYESLASAKQYRDMLERIPNRAQQVNPTNTAQPNVFNQCIKATNEFLGREQKDRLLVTKRYLEPLTDVINGVPHKMMRLDDDTNYSIAKIRATHHSSLLPRINDEINQLPEDIYSIECVPISRTRKTSDKDDEYLGKNSVVLRCKLSGKHNAAMPPLRLYITASYPKQAPEVLSLTKTMPPRLEFTGEHPLFDQVSSMFVSHLFKLRAQHSITDILNIWRLSVQAIM